MSLRLADVMRQHGEAYLARYRDSILPSHKKAIFDILRCRTPALGGHLAACGRCGAEHVFHHSCRNRACPRCGKDRTAKWIAKQRASLLDVRYFHVVFTLPHEWGRTVRSHQKALLPVLFRAAFESLASLCEDKHFLGARIGALAVLHTWTRTLEWHPHIHMLVPGGGVRELASGARAWVSVPRRRIKYLVPVKALSKGFRGRFVHLARRALPNIELPFVPKKKRWVVFAKPTVNGTERVLDYLGRYVHRTALSDTAIVACDDKHVTFTYRKTNEHTRRTMTLPAEEFLRRFLQHVPHKGLHRVRAFGLLHRVHRDTLQQLRLSGAKPQRNPSDAEHEEAREKSNVVTLRCPRCGQSEMRIVRRLSGEECLRRADPAARARAPP